jgi:putative hydrolases of HD superfamily
LYLLEWRQMKTRNKNPVQFLTGKSVEPLIIFYFQANHLKQLLRQGWLQKGRDIPEFCCESDGDHCFLLTLLALVVCDTYFPQLDKLKVITMCLLHEVGEIIIGDQRTPTDEAGKVDKYKREQPAVHELLKDILPGQYYIELWEEFETGQTPEAKLVRQIDKLEMAFQSKVYSLQHSKNLQEFIDDVRTKLQSPELLNLLDQIEAL